MLRQGCCSAHVAAGTSGRMWISDTVGHVVVDLHTECNIIFGTDVENSVNNHSFCCWQIIPFILVILMNDSAVLL